MVKLTNMLKSMLVLCGSCLSFWSCIDEIRPSVGSGEEIFIVDAKLTDQANKTQVILSKSFDLDVISTDLGVIENEARVSNALVRVVDENNVVRVSFSEESPGLYLPDTHDVAVGGTYRLLIDLEDNRQYDSPLIEMLPAPAIDSTWAEYVEKEVLNEQGEVVDLEQAINVSALINHGSGDNYYSFQGKLSSKVFIRGPEPPFSGPFCPLPPEDLECWRFLDDTVPGIALLSTEGSSRTQSETVAFSIPIRNRGLNFILLTVESLTEDAFRFSIDLRSHLETKNTIFSPPLKPLIGNIRNVRTSKEVVIGYFNVASLVEASLCFDSNEFLPDNVRFISPQAGNCTGETCVDFWSDAVRDVPSSVIADKVFFGNCF